MIKIRSIRQLTIAFITLFAVCFLSGNAHAWWDSNYQYRKQITITNNSDATVSIDSLAGFTTDTQSLINGSKLRSDGKDWRIVYDNGGTENEIGQKIESGWNTTSTETWFRLEAAINNGESDSNYYVYYGYTSESTSADTLNPAQTTDQIVYSVTSGGGNGSSLACDFDNSNEWGHMQGFDFNQTYDSWWNITKFDYYVTSRGSSDSASLAGFIFDGVNKGEGEEITNGKGIEFANNSISTYSWNTAAFSSPYPKVKELTTYYAGLLPTNPADRGSTGKYFRWDYSSSDVKGGVQGYHTNQGASSWVSSLISPSGADFLMKIYADEASNDDLAAALEFESGQPTALCDEWWDDTYFGRKKITITAGTEQIPSGYSVSVTFDHADMVSEDSAQADGDDVRVVYWNGATWTELDRAVDPLSSWNDASTKIWFKTQAIINASSSDSDYYIYYNKSSASNPPDDWANIFMIGDDFNDGTL
ncbi:MAG: hypothetical protein PVJ82_08675, partial [Desulfobacteraceae bacterium]